MPSASEIIASKGLIRGFLRPIFYDELGRGSALTTEDFEKVRAGYACAACLAEFVMYLARCPVCGHERDVEQDLQAPDPLHVSHLKDREATEGMDVGAPRGFDEFMRSVEADPDVEQIRLSQLKKRRRR